MESYLIPALIVLCASLLQACTGFGFSIMATPFLLMVFSPHAAIQINIILSIVISLLVVPAIHKEIDRPLFFRLVKGSAIGAPIGIAVYALADVELLRLGVSVIILTLTAMLALKYRIRHTPAMDYVTGNLSGILTTSLGLPGVPLLLYFTGGRVDKGVLRSTALAYFLFIYTVALVLQFVVGSTDEQSWTSAVLLIPVTILGLFLGQALFRFVDQRRFEVITLVILGTTGAYLLATSIGTWFG